MDYCLSPRARLKMRKRKCSLILTWLWTWWRKTFLWLYLRYFMVHGPLVFTCFCIIAHVRELTVLHKLLVAVRLSLSHGSTFSSLDLLQVWFFATIFVPRFLSILMLHLRMNLHSYLRNWFHASDVMNLPKLTISY